MKRWISLFLAAIMAFGVSCAFAEDEIFIDDTTPGFSALSGEPDDGEAEMELVPYDYDDIVVGNPTPLNGQFFTGLWGNATSDIDVRYLVTGYNLVTWDGEISLFRFDRSVVSGAMISDDAEGNRSYLISLYSNLYYSDGTPITAWDYAFSVLFQNSPVIGELGGHPAVCDYLVGYEDYAAGAAPYISGLRVPADNMIIFTVKKEALPYFYELSRLSFDPYPIQAIAPGCAVRDDGNGAYIAGEDVNTGAPLFTADLLRETVLNPSTGYMSHPDPVAGPYCLVSFDGENAVFEVNPYYKGNEAGKKPRIKHLTYTAADNDTMIQKLGEGEFALLNKVTYAPTISEGLRLCMEKAQYSRSVYLRTGLTYIFFNPDSLAIQQQGVRQAVAFCFDKKRFITNYVGTFGLEMDGLYGMSQWTYSAATGAMAYPVAPSEEATPEEEAAYEENAAAWDAVSLDELSRYEPDVDAAVSLLEEAGWTLNERGEPFDPLKDQVRCRNVAGELCALELTLGYQPRADVEQAFADCLAEQLAQAGIRLTIIPLEFDNIVDAHNEHLLDGVDLIYFGDNFNISFDPALFFHGEDQDQEALEEDSLRTVYEALFALSKDMDHTEPQDILGYLQKWVTFQKALSETLPIIPVYSNVYFDFYTRELDEYWIDTYESWGRAIVPARMRSIRQADQDKVGIEIELSYANGEGEIDWAALTQRAEREAADYSAGAMSLFPAYVREQVPSGYATIYEFVAATLDSEIDEEADETEMKFAFQTPYEENEAVYLLFGIPGKGSDVEWFVRQGSGAPDGDVLVTLEKAQLEKLAGITFALAVVSQ